MLVQKRIFFTCRLKVLKKFCGFDVPLDDPDLQRYHEWHNAIFARASVQATALYEKNKEYLDGVRIILTRITI